MRNSKSESVRFLTDSILKLMFLLNIPKNEVLRGPVQCCRENQVFWVMVNVECPTVKNLIKK